MPKSKQILKEKEKNRGQRGVVSYQMMWKRKNMKKCKILNGVLSGSLPLTRILLIAATISTRLLGRATSRLPMY